MGKRRNDNFIFHKMRNEFFNLLANFSGKQLKFKFKYKSRIEKIKKKIEKKN